MQELALQTKPATALPTAVLRVAARPGGRSPRGGRGSGACGRFRAARAAARCAEAAPRPRNGSPRCGPCRCGWTSRSGCRGRGRSGRRSCRSRRRGGPPRARGTRASTSRAFIIFWRAACASSERATTSRPEVSRSSRCTIPARSGCSPPAASGCQRLRERRPAMPGRGVRDHAGRLVHHEQVLVLVDDLEGNLVRRARLGVARRAPPRPRARPSPTRWFLGRGCAVHRHSAALDQALGRRPGRRGAARGEECVEPQAGVLGPGDQLVRGRFGLPSTRPEQQEHARPRCRRRPR